MKAPLSSSSSTSSFCSSIAKKARFSPLLLALALFLLCFSFLYGEDLKELLGRQAQVASQLVVNSSSRNNGGDEHPAAPPPEAAEGKTKTKRKWQGRLAFALNDDDEDEECDVFSGRWVRDDASRYPLYREEDCPYIHPQLTCQAHGRPDAAYQRWRWQPHGCALPAFDAARVLEALRGKRMLFVGDSLGRGQFASMVCLLHSAIPGGGGSSLRMSPDQQHTVFAAGGGYNATVEFYWAPFLLESNSDDAAAHRISERMVRRGSIDYHGRHWRGADVVVFNTYLWWCTGLRFRILNGPWESAGTEGAVSWVSTEEAYGMAFRDMLQWVRDNMDLNTTRVFFTSMSPTHQKSQDWGDAAGGNCYNETAMISEAGYWGSDGRRSVMRVIREILDGDGADVPLTFLNVTQLSMYRKDAHTSIYKRQWSQPTAEQLADPKTYADCVHWCLPGLQDTWNELLYSKLFYP
ncbi:protein trichome birefringence-like 33 [Panicum virgatum]|uniref:Trichome birefringence-like N-terminal domain-containing protein n=1 Tax=Panicum virgatum TaxID=38727 RepID=A0A8T0UAQ4_PANVG|nr:protein trichome birefringence-like 33 [Panicum virgatum]KAG2619860.1 hypothetical protein PVAP13_3NG139500 [Panicum virgatum]